MRKVVIFDCDGVLRDFSWLFIYQAYIEICKHFEINHLVLWPNFQYFKNWFNHDWKDNLRRMGIGQEEDLYLATRIFHEFYDSNIKIFPWVQKVIQDLSTRFEVAVFSNSLLVSVSKSLIEISDLISVLVCSDNLVNLKPHPEGLNLILHKLKVSPKNAWMVGDTIVDIQAGQAARVNTAIVSWGITESQVELSATGADVIIQKPEDLLFLL